MELFRPRIGFRYSDCFVKIWSYCPPYIRSIKTIMCHWSENLAKYGEGVNNKKKKTLVTLVFQKQWMTKVWAKMVRHEKKFVVSQKNGKQWYMIFVHLSPQITNSVFRHWTANLSKKIVSQERRCPQKCKT